MDWKKAGVWTGAVLTALLILLFSFKFVAMDDNYQKTLITPRLAEFHSDVLKYLLGFSESVPTAFSKEESSHISDVRKLFKKIFVATYALLALWFLALLSLRDKQLVKKSLRLGAVTSLIIVLIIFIASLISFTSFFNAVHEPFFTEKSWIFTSDSLLITLYPESFFQTMALRWGIIVFFTSVIIGLLQYCLNGSGGGGAGH
ncbi:DUF1461 domain-containing protein [Candidatus Woesearchaeota archaeon]|nr:DUF1461 domain-containing protein [Candidatus Woesearchaeota archaeon]